MANVLKSSDKTLTYLMSFIDGYNLVYNEEKLPGTTKLTRIDPDKILAPYTKNDFQINFSLDLTLMSGAILNKIYVFLKLPEQPIVKKGDFFAWADYPAIKAINRIDIMFGTYDNIVESIPGSALYMKMLNAYPHDNDKWSNLATYLGGELNSLNYSSIGSTPTLLPIPCDVFPLDLQKIVADRNEPIRLYIKIIYNSVSTFSTYSPYFTPNNLVTPKDTSECFLIIEEVQKVLAPLNAQHSSTRQADYHKLNRTNYVYSETKSMTVKSNFEKIPDNLYVNSLTLYMANPYVAGNSPELFYGSLCYNALENFLNSFIYPPNVQLPLPDKGILNLRTGFLNNPFDGVTVQLLNASSYVITYEGGIYFELISANLPWADLPEDYSLNLIQLLQQKKIPVKYIKTLFFYMAPTASEDVTEIPNLNVNGYQGIVEGQFLSLAGDWVIYGIGFVDLKRWIGDTEMAELKLAVSLPIDNDIKSQFSPFAIKRFCYVCDPIYQFMDMDRSLRLGASDVEFHFTNKQTQEASSAKVDWNDTLYNNYVNTAANNQRILPVTIFNFGVSEPNGFFDTVSTVLEMKYNLDLFDRNSRSANLTNLKSYITRSVKVDYIFILLRFIVFSENKIFTYTTNNDVYNTIINTFYKGAEPSQGCCDGDIVLRRRVLEQRRKRAKGVHLNFFNQ